MNDKGIHSPFNNTTGNIRSQFPMTSNQSWQRKPVTIPAGFVQSVTFDNTTPNMFYIVNYSSTDLRISINSIPTVNRYEFLAPGNETSTFGQPIPTQQIYILNPSSSPVDALIFSVYDTFDFNVIRSSSVKLSADSIQDMGVVNGFGSGVSLPGGQAHLGSVDVDNLVNYTSILNNISSKLNNLNVNSDVEALPAALFTALTEIKNAITAGGSDVDYSTVLNNILTKLNATLSTSSTVTELPTALYTALTAIETAVNNIDVSGGGGSGGSSIDYTTILTSLQTILTSIQTAVGTIDTDLDTLKTDIASIDDSLDNIYIRETAKVISSSLSWTGSQTKTVAASCSEISMLRNTGTQALTLSWKNNGDTTAYTLSIPAGYTLTDMKGSFTDVTINCTASGGACDVVYKTI